MSLCPNLFSLSRDSHRGLQAVLVDIVYTISLFHLCLIKISLENVDIVRRMPTNLPNRYAGGIKTTSLLS